MTPFNASQVAQVFLDNVYKLHGLSESIISDRDKVFISNFWKALFSELNVKLKLSTAYHPQTDGQTEVVNRCLGCYLRCMSGDKPKDWMKWLPLAEFWYNITSIQPLTPLHMKLYIAKHPLFSGDSRVETVDRTLHARQEVVNLLKFHLKRAQDRMKSQADKHKTDRQFEDHQIGALPKLREDGLFEYKPMAILERRLGSRPYFPHNATTAALLAASNADGICSSMVQPHGYTCEEHKVTTKDGYVLSLQRIPLGRAGGKEGSRVPVLLQHGLLMDGITWLLSPPDQSLALVLADNDFDVWIVSSRGTKYSRGHVSLKTEDEAYWDWSWDELSAYDLPATFQYVQSQTGQKLHYVGHSLGTLTAMAAFSKGELVSMLRSAALLSPVAYVGQITSPLGRNAAETFIAEALKWLGLHEFHPRGDVVTKFLKKICAKPGIDCTNLLNSFTGKNCCLKPSIVDVFLDHEPQPSSTKNMMHVAQMIREGTIQMYDYQDAGENRRRYGQSTPPAYNIANIPKNVPLFLSHGGADALSDVEDVKHLLRTLKDHDRDKIQVQFIRDYAHADFVMATNAKQSVYEPLMAFFKLH
ncbi:triacylglycerol lipase 2-like protein [Tanacetum coccineum]